MRVLILTCNTGGGHNAVAATLRDSLQRCGASCDVMDGLGFISKKASKFVSKWHTRFYRRYPRLYKAGYMSAEGDKEIAATEEAFHYQIGKEVGAMAAVMKGKVDQIILTGGIAYGQETVDAITDMVGWIAPITVYPGEDELLALAQGALRVLNGEEPARVY